MITTYKKMVTTYALDHVSIREAIKKYLEDVLIDGSYVSLGSTFNLDITDNKIIVTTEDKILHEHETKNI